MNGRSFFARARRAFLQRAKRGDRFSERLLDKEADIGGHLVVAGAAGVQFRACVADAVVSSRSTAMWMSSSVGRNAMRAVSRNRAAMERSPVFILRMLAVAQNADRVAAPRAQAMLPGDVLPDERLVERERVVERFHEAVGRFAETSVPHFHSANPFDFHLQRFFAVPFVFLKRKGERHRVRAA